ncbi:hypothetical protein AIOL_003603 [Candidatus Rhodobacter oscarellae]|uniref:Lipoprotein n=1 Tax=Candidatus Rhodobacter oscarellae TaxID=1675527 RepID=A0A0J9E797_9RHOB|nr:hypothetical protein [Candidatus Rhodobacter lobularis]KMW58625.1 hypothetical protein AIOL_003603 [Candidatus Rhodobacter lobularis]
MLAAGGAALALAGCGFSPVYAPGGQADGLQGQILADEPRDRNAFVFVGQFEERLGRAAAPRFALRYRIRTRVEGVGLTPAGETTRLNVFGAVDYTLVEMGTDREVTRGFVENFTGFSATRLIVSTQTVDREAHERLMVLLADQVVTRLIATAPEWRGSN